MHNHGRSQTDYKVINCHYNYGISLDCSMPYSRTPFVGFDVSGILYSIYDLLFKHFHDDDGLINNLWIPSLVAFVSAIRKRFDRSSIEAPVYTQVEAPSLSVCHVTSRPFQACALKLFQALPATLGSAASWMLALLKIVVVYKLRKCDYFKGRVQRYSVLEWAPKHVWDLRRLLIRSRSWDHLWMETSVVFLYASEHVQTGWSES